MEISTTVTVPATSYRIVLRNIRIDFRRERLTYDVDVVDPSTGKELKDHGLPTDCRVEGTPFATQVAPRIRGDGNLLAGIRTHYKNQLPATAGDVTDLDTDD